MKTIKLKDILSISGKGGLYKFVAQARNGIVVESIEDHKRHVAPSTARVSSLEDIAIFTEEEEVPLSDVFYRIHETSGGEETLSHKASSEELTQAFQELVPDYDQERVYLSDIRKVFQWYNQLQKFQLLEIVDKDEEKDKEQAAETSEPPPENQQKESGDTKAASTGGKKSSDHSGSELDKP